MDKNTSISNKGLGESSPYLDRVGIPHIIDDWDTRDQRIRWTGKLIAVIGKNLLFEKTNGLRVLVDPSKVARIIEVNERRR